MDAQLQQFMRRAVTPLWMPAPETWCWPRADQVVQGFAPRLVDHPGRANLLWLTLGLRQPPEQYDARTNPLYMAVATHRYPQLEDQARLLTLAEFASLPQREYGAAELRKRALQRIIHAHS